MRDPEYPPEELARDYISAPTFSSGEEVMTATRHLIAKDLAFHPGIRQQLRSIFNNYAVISTLPTEEGKRVITPFHPSRDIKHLDCKPVLAFVTNSDQFLRFFHYIVLAHIVRILKAAEEKLLTYTISLKDDDYTYRVLEVLKRGYCSDGQSELAMKWNEERERILELMLQEYLIPSFKKQVKEKLASEGKLSLYKI